LRWNRRQARGYAGFSAKARGTIPGSMIAGAIEEF